MNYLFVRVSRARDTLMTSESNPDFVCQKKTPKRETKKREVKKQEKAEEKSHFLLSRLISIIASHRFASHLSTASLRFASNQSSASHLLRIASHLLRITSTSNHIYNFKPLTHKKGVGEKKQTKGMETQTRAIMA